jgi:hypothetical protein
MTEEVKTIDLKFADRDNFSSSSNDSFTSENLSNRGSVNINQVDKFRKSLTEDLNSKIKKTANEKIFMSKLSTKMKSKVERKQTE